MTLRSQRSKSRHSVRGFTLVELQIAMLIMTMIALLMAGALRASVQAWRSSTEHQDVSEHRFLVEQFLRRHLSGMRFTRFQYEAVGSMVSFMGTGEAIHFVAPYPGFDSDGSLYWWTLKNQWSEEKERERLVLEYVPYEPRDMVEYDARSGIVLEEVEPGTLVVDDALRLVDAEFYADDSRGISGWLGEWEPGRRTPRALRLRLREIEAEGETHALPEITIAPRFNVQRLDFTDGG